MRIWIVQAALALALAFSAASEGKAQGGEAAQDRGDEPAKAYVVSEIAPHDTERYTAYLRQVLPLMESHGGRVLVSPFSPARAIEGRALEGNFAVLEFPSVEARNAFWNSPEYRAIKPLRQGAATSRIIHTD